jgi:glycerol-1-phosphate dehydrogenase [NAD(P)+]
MTDALERLHAGLFPDPDGGAPLGAPSGEIEIAPSLDGREADLVEQLDLGRRLAVVSDVTTRQVLGRRVERALDKVATIEPVVLPRRPQADDASAARLRAATRDADALIAVGSGTINDLAKHVAAEAGRPYAVFATAPSMNGYTSVSAAITVGGLKRSLPARAPRGAFFDLEVLAAAPRRLILAGLGESLCRATGCWRIFCWGVPMARPRSRS